jgi:hypothetical protein
MERLLAKWHVNLGPHLPMPLVGMGINFMQHSLLELLCIDSFHRLPTVHRVWVGFARHKSNWVLRLSLGFAVLCRLRIVEHRGSSFNQAARGNRLARGTGSGLRVSMPFRVRWLVGDGLSLMSRSNRGRGFRRIIDAIGLFLFPEIDHSRLLAHCRWSFSLLLEADLTPRGRMASPTADTKRDSSCHFDCGRVFGSCTVSKKSSNFRWN